MPAAHCPVRPGAGTGLPSLYQGIPRYDVGMATAAMSQGAERESLAPACVQLGFRLGQSVLDLEVADDAALHLIEDAYAPLVCSPTGARPRASLRRLSDGRLHVRYGRQALQFANAADPVPLRAGYHAAREIFARFACEARGSTAFYAAFVAIDDRGVLLLGPTTIGKTILALQLAHDGARFLGDETALLSLTTGEAYAIPRRPALRESGLPLLPRPEFAEAVLKSDKCFSTERGRFWYAIDGRTLPGAEPAQRAYEVRAICIVRERCEQPFVLRIDPAQGVKHLAQRAYCRPTSLAQLAALRRSTRRAAFFEIGLGTPKATSEMLLQEVRACE